MKSGVESDEELAAEAIRQLRDRDDRRDAAEMRVEELVRDPEFAPEAGPARPESAAGVPPATVDARRSSSLRSSVILAAAAIALLYLLFRFAR